MSKAFIYGKYEKEEELAFNAFKKAATGITSTSEYHETNYGTYYDVWAKHKNGQVEHIELKLRKAGADNNDTAYIEPEKWINLMKDYRERQEHPLPIYINFIGNETNVYVWNLQNIKNAKFHASVWIDGEYQDRIGLYWTDAWHFVKQEDGNYKLVNKGK